MSSSSSSSSGTTTSPFESLAFSTTSIYPDPGRILSNFYFHNSEILFHIVLPSNFWSSCQSWYIGLAIYATGKYNKYNNIYLTAIGFSPGGSRF